MSPEETPVLVLTVLLKPGHHSWGQYPPPQLHCRLPSSFLKGPPKSPTPSHSAPENSQDIHECDSHVPQVGDGVSMKEGPEALVGGPPLSLSVGPALSAFRLWLPGRDTTPDPLEDMLFSHFVHWHLSHPHLPSKGLSAAAQPTWYFFSGGFLAWVVGPGDGHREGGGRGKINKVHRACFGFYLGPYCSSCSATGVCNQADIGSFPPTFPRALKAERGCHF